MGFCWQPLDSASNELPLPWTGVPRFAGKVSGLFGGEQRFGGVRYPYYFTGNFRECRKVNLLPMKRL
jgi:hypothetical protein